MTVENKPALQARLNLVRPIHSTDIDLPEGLGPFFDTVMDKSVGVLKDGFTTRSPGGIFTRVLTRSTQYVFEVEMSRTRQETHYDYNVVFARTPAQDDINGPYTFASFIRRDRDMGTDETYASKTGGLFGNDMSDSEKKNFEKEYLGSQVDVALTTKHYEYYVGLFGNNKDTQIEWPSQGIGTVVK